jgi:hypothetical protein
MLKALGRFSQVNGLYASNFRYSFHDGLLNAGFHSHEAHFAGAAVAQQFQSNNIICRNLFNCHVASICNQIRTNGLQ